MKKIPMKRVNKENKKFMINIAIGACEMDETCVPIIRMKCVIRSKRKSPEIVDVPEIIELNVPDVVHPM